LSPYELLVTLCGGTWNGVIVHVITNVMIGAAYISIPIVIVAYLRRRPDIENRWVFWCFTAFILGCGFTHFGHVLALWDPRFYLFSQLADIFTAVVSCLTAIALWPLLPAMARIPTPRQLMRMIHERDEAVGQLGQHKEILVKELNHRVRNNLQILQGVVSMMMRDSRSSGTPPQQLLGTILNRIMAVSRVHDRIYSDSLQPGQIETREFIESICRDLGTQFGAAIETDIDRMMMTVDESVPVAMIVNELVTNALKYGRHGDRQAQVKVVFKRQEEDKWLLSVEDNGPGLPPDAEKGRSIGMRLIRSLATQLGGALEVASSPAGSRFSINGAMARAGAGSSL
jgi:two-component sensor histidine kinase